jgi:hypothetical protein
MRTSYLKEGMGKDVGKAKSAGDKARKETEHPVRIISRSFGSLIVEALYDRATGKTRCAIVDRESGQEVRYQDEFTHCGVKYLPLKSSEDILTKRILLLPSVAAEYGSDEALVQEITGFVRDYVHISPEMEQVIPLYVLMSWVYDGFREVPYLRVIGDYASGKSRFLQVVGSLCYKPIFATGATTPSPVFRLVSDIKGTLIIDEADFSRSDKDAEIVKILNSGYQKGFGVMRTEGKGTFEVKMYDVFCPKIVATRERFKDEALESRCLTERMGNVRLRDSIPLSLDEAFDERALALQNKLLMWRLRNLGTKAQIKAGRSLSAGSEYVEPRLRQICSPLYAVAGTSEALRQLLDTFLISYDKETKRARRESMEGVVLAAIATLLSSSKQKSRAKMTVKEIAGKASEEDGDGTEMQPRLVGGALRRLHLIPHRTRLGWTLDTVEYRERLNSLWARYGVQYTSKENIVNDVNIQQNKRPDVV